MSFKIKVFLSFGYIKLFQKQVGSRIKIHGFVRRLNWKNTSGKTYPDPSGFETSILMFCPLQITSILPVWPTPCCNESWMTSQVPNVISSVGDQNIFKKYLYWAFPIHLITMLRTESELELSPLRGKCCQALLLHQRTYIPPLVTHHSRNAIVRMQNPIAFIKEASTALTIPQFWPPDSLDYRSKLILPA